MKIEDLGAASVVVAVVAAVAVAVVFGVVVVVVVGGMVVVIRCSLMSSTAFRERSRRANTTTSFHSGSVLITLYVRPRASMKCPTPISAEEEMTLIPLTLMFTLPWAMPVALRM